MCARIIDGNWFFVVEINVYAMYILFFTFYIEHFWSSWYAPIMQETTIPNNKTTSVPLFNNLNGAFI